jgi:hypothetical protein
MSPYCPPPSAAAAQAATEVSKYIRFLEPEASVGMLYMMKAEEQEARKEVQEQARKERQETEAFLKHRRESNTRRREEKMTKEALQVQPLVQQEWTKQVDPRSGKAYYWNQRTATSSWTTPPGFQETEKQQQEAEKQRKEAEKHDEKLHAIETEKPTDISGTKVDAEELEKPVTHPFIPLPEEAARIPGAVINNGGGRCVVSRPIDCANEILLLSASYNPHVILL